MPISNDELDKVEEYEKNDIVRLEKMIKKDELKCFDIIQTMDDEFYVVMDKTCGKAWNQLRGYNYYDDIDAYLVNYETHDIERLGLNSFDQDLYCRTNHHYDIIAIYRSLYPTKYSKMTFKKIYAEIKKKLNIK